MSKEHYYSKLYNLQDTILNLLDTCDTNFYLTGGTALGRIWLNHRYSDDLDFFLNEDNLFKNYVQKIIKTISSSFKYEIGITSETFVRIFIYSNETTLKVEFINDVPFHFGEFHKTEIFSKVDNWRNILSNKISALERLAPKDIADIIFISEKYKFNWKEVLEEAKQKDLWVDEIAVSDYIYNFDITKLESVNWIEHPDYDKLALKLKQIAKSILLGNDN